MHLFIATDNAHKYKNLWMVGGSDWSIGKIKEYLKLDPKSGSVDRVVKSEHMKDILDKLRTTLKVREETNEEGIRVFLVEGEHSHLANTIYEITFEFESERKSFRRSFMQWLTSVSV